MSITAFKRYQLWIIVAGLLISFLADAIVYTSGCGVSGYVVILFYGGIAMAGVGVFIRMYKADGNIFRQAVVPILASLGY